MLQSIDTENLSLIICEVGPQALKSNFAICRYYGVNHNALLNTTYNDGRNIGQSHNDGHRQRDVLLGRTAQKLHVVQNAHIFSTCW